MIHVMTFNVRADNILDIHNRWQRRADLVYDVLAQYAPDIVGLQEVTIKMFKDLKESNLGYQVIGEGRTKRYFSERNNLFINKQYTVKEQETFWLSATPNKAGSSIWYSLFPRICTTAAVQLKNGQVIRVYNTHLDCLFPHARTYGLKIISNYIEKKYQEEKLPCILMGDFNAQPGSKLIKQFREGNYGQRHFIAVQDAKNELYSQATMGHFKGKTTGLHIDYIFVSEEFKINNVEIIKYNRKGKYPSDHYPIMAELEL